MQVRDHGRELVTKGAVGTRILGSALAAPTRCAAKMGIDGQLPVALNAIVALEDVDDGSESNHGNNNAEHLGRDRLDDIERAQSNKPPPHWQLGRFVRPERTDATRMASERERETDLGHMKSTT